jgi:hypothetical protein
VDATGLAARHASAYYQSRRSSPYRARRYPLLAVACHTRTHLIAGAVVLTGPANEAPGLVPVMTQASTHARWDRVLADAAYDTEENHRVCRENLGVRSTVIPLNPRGNGRKWPRTRYRRQMVRRFRRKPAGNRSRRVYGQRWQAESVFSRHKRRLGDALRSRSTPAWERECYLRVLTHNLMLLADP